MSSALDNASNTALRIALRMAGHAVTYARGETTLQRRAIPAQSVWDEQSDGYSVRAATSRDYLLQASAIAALGEPVSGDTITDGTEKYEVASPDGERPWRYVDRGQLWYRVHTKRTV